MLVNKNLSKTGINELMTGNGNNVDFITLSRTDEMQGFIDDLVVELLKDAGANIDK